TLATRTRRPHSPSKSHPANHSKSSPVSNIVLDCHLPLGIRVRQRGRAMKAQNRIRTASLLLAALFASTAAAQDFRTARVARQVLVSIPDRKLVVLEGGKVVRTFPVAVGAKVSPSPSGEFKIVNRIADPTY